MHRCLRCHLYTTMSNRLSRCARPRPDSQLAMGIGNTELLRCCERLISKATSFACSLERLAVANDRSVVAVINTPLQVNASVCRLPQHDRYELY